jgi:hypothetical protein
LAYAVSASTSINQIKQTTDGGYIAVGSAQNIDGLIAALVLKLDGNGAVQWQRELGSGTTAAYFNAVLQTSDGGYAVLGESYVTGTPLPVTSVLLVAFGADGTVRWQQNYNNLDSPDLSPTSSEHADSIIQTSEGGYLIGGDWGHGMGQGAYGGALLLKLTSTGDIVWQQVYSEFGRQFHGGAQVFSILQVNDGYVITGDGWFELGADRTQLVPWLAKMDFNGNYLWQYFYFDIGPTTGRILSEYFASSAYASDGGFLSLGNTVDDNNNHGELYAVKTDSAGIVEGKCDQLHDPTVYDTFDPLMISFSPSLPVQTTVTPGEIIQTRAQTTSIVVRAKCDAQPSPSPTPTLTPTPTAPATATPTATFTPSPTPTATLTPTPTASVTPTPVTRATPTPRPRSTPGRRPT